MIYVLPTLWAVVTFVFFIIRLVPGGPAMAVLGSYATAESIRELEKQMGLDKPLIVQYGNFLKDLCRGDLGKSMITKRPVSSEIAKALPLLFLDLMPLPNRFESSKNRWASTSPFLFNMETS